MVKKAVGERSLPLPSPSLSLLPYPPVLSPLLSPSPAAKRPPENQPGGLGERYKLPQWGPRRNILVYFELENRTWRRVLKFVYRRILQMPWEKKQLYRQECRNGVPAFIKVAKRRCVASRIDLSTELDDGGAIIRYWLEALRQHIPPPRQPLICSICGPLACAFSDCCRTRDEQPYCQYCNGKIHSFKKFRNPNPCPDKHQNLIDWSLDYFQPFRTISERFGH